MHDQFITSHCLLDKTRNKKNNGFYLHYMNTSSPSYVLIKQKRKKKNTVWRSETMAGNASKPSQIHQTPGAKTEDTP